ncbi:WIAG-tail domain [Paenibacillus filicis]
MICFGTAYANEQYALVATVTDPHCYAVIKEKRTEGATFTIVRSKSSAKLLGLVNWIGIGVQAAAAN